MSAAPCCQSHSNFFRRAFGISQWILPTAILALLPKCPACLAAYVLLWTGVGLSLSTAGIVRMALLVLSISALMFLAFKVIRNAIAGLSQTKES